MNEAVLFTVGHYAHKLHCSRVVKCMAQLALPAYCIDKTDAVESFWPDKGASCIFSHKISSAPKYDLQIVVPCYNVADYVVECVESILNQRTKFTYKVVIVNDGSTDGTRERISCYEHLSNVEIIDQKNGGLSAARNAGIREVDAKYLMFVDSDDVLPKDAVEVLLTRALCLDADIVEGGYVRFSDGKILHTCALPDSDNNRNISGFAWGKVYKSSLFSGLQYPEKYWYEDTFGYMVLFDQAVKIATVSDIVYHWRKNILSITSISKGNIRSADSFWITKRLLEDRHTLGLPFDEQFLDFFLYQVRINCVRISRIGISKLNKSVFVDTCHLLKRYFDSGLESHNFRPLQCSMLTESYKDYLIECLLS